MTPGDSAEADDLRILLISPVRGVDPLSGDVTYTEQLLNASPPGVTYTTYVDALMDGTLVECGTRRAVQDAGGIQRLGQLGIALWRKVEYRARRTGWVYREPLRIWKVAPGAYDAVHVHVFHSRFLGRRPPVVMSAAGPLSWVYGDAWGWSKGRRAIAESFDRVVGAVWNASMCGVRMGDIERFVAFSAYFGSWLERHGWNADRIEVVPNYLGLETAPTPPSVRGSAPDEALRLGFVAKDFVAKGGEVLLDAYRVLRQRHPELALELTIVGSPPLLGTQELAPLGITWLPFVPRDRLLSDVLPTIDILVYPSLVDGLPYGPMEAMAMGIPLVVSDYRALPELVGDTAGVVSRVRDVGSVVSAVEALLDRDVRDRASRKARQRFADHFSAMSQAPRLARIYRSAIAAGKDSPTVPFTPPETVSVVIATYNRPDHVRICLEHLARQTLHPVETVVVDSSPDNATEIVVKDFPEVMYLRNDRGRGHTATSRAMGVAHTSGEVIAYIDDDAYAEPTWLEELLRRYDDDSIAAVGGRASNGKPGEELEGWDEIGKILPDGRLTGNFAADPGRDIDVDHLLGANMSVRRDVVEALGGIHDHYPGTCLREETDIALRMRKAGYRIIYTPAAGVVHVGGTYAKGHRFDTRYKYYGARNHMVLLAVVFGFRDSHTLGNLRAVAGWVASDLKAAAKAPLDPDRQRWNSKLRGVVGPLAAIAAHTGGTLVGTAAACRIRLQDWSSKRAMGARSGREDA